MEKWNKRKRVWGTQTGKEKPNQSVLQQHCKIRVSISGFLPHADTVLTWEYR